MELQRRSRLIFGILAGAWLLIIVWQVEEHLRVRNAARTALVNRAKDISTTLGIVLRSQRRFGGVVSKERLEASLAELVKQESVELKGIALLNAAGEMVASAGTATNVQANGIIAGPTERWGAHVVTLMNPVDLGTNLTYDIEGTNPPIILSRQDFTNRLATNRMGMPLSRPPPDRTNEPPAEPRSDGNPTNLVAAGGTPLPPAELGTNRERPREGGFRARFGRPRWMSEEEYLSLLQKQGVHSFVIVMSTQAINVIWEQDFWVRAIIAVLATISVLGSGLAWRNLSQTADLQIRLVRASELNSHLKEMNLAAAGLAHETRNPLNLIRGQAQLISRLPDASPNVREKSKIIVDETDKVTAQLTEFINYSRPREVRRTKVALIPACQEIVRTLGYDLGEKKLRVEVGGEPLAIEADEQLLRQVMFNLLLNAAQAAGESGHIEILVQRSGNEAVLEIRDDGPGVPPERRQEIFKPYFTTTQKGTGLGLAVVSQIVLAHGWEIACLGNEPHGAVFRLTHLKIAA